MQSFFLLFNRYLSEKVKNTKMCVLHSCPIPLAKSPSASRLRTARGAVITA